VSIEQSFKRWVTSLFRLFLRSRIAPPPSPDRVKSILIVRQHNQLGDMLCVVPLLRSLRQKYPGAYLCLIASPVNADVMKNNRYLDEVILYDKREFLQKGRIRGAALWRFVRSLRKKRFDVAVVPSTVSMSFTSDLLAYLSGAPCRIGAGSLNGVLNRSAFLFTAPTNLDWSGSPDRHQTLRNFDIARPLGVEEPADLTLEITLTREELEEGRTFVEGIKKGKPYAIGYHPGAGKVPNRWPAEKFASAISRLSADLNGAALLTCGPMDGDVVSAVENRLQNACYVVTNQSIRRVASILKWLDLVVTNDTGVMHVAAAVGVPVLSLFGPTSPTQWAPQGDRHRYICGVNGDICTISVENVVEEGRLMIC
jgi:heptosyltransferase II